MGSLITKGLFLFLVLIILQDILLVSQKFNNFSVTIIIFPLDRTLRQWEAAVLRTIIAAYQRPAGVDRILQETVHALKARNLIYPKAMTNAIV